MNCMKMIKNLSKFTQFTIMDWNTLHTILDVLHEVLRRIDPKNTSYSWVQFSENDPKQYRKCYFSVPKRSMNRLIAKKDKYKANLEKKEETSNENYNQLYKKYKK